MIVAIALALLAAPDTSAATAPPGAAPRTAAVSAATSDSVAATAPADTSVRVPGLPLRFGWPESRMGPLGYRVDRGTRVGECRWFGVAGIATVRFAGGALAGVHVELKNVSGRDAAYVQDELARRGLRRWCSEDTPARRVCTWTGAAGRAQVTQSGPDITADLAPPPAPPAPATPVVRALPPPLVQTLPETLWAPQPRLPEGARLARVVSAPQLSYPERARHAGVGGRVWVLALVDTNGVVRQAQVLRSIPELDEAALSAVRQYRFAPELREARPVRFWVRVSLVFTLH